MKKLNRGIKEIIAGLVGGLLFSAVLSFFQQSGLIPQNLVIWFTVIGLISSIITIFSFQTAGIIFTLGWILGAWLLKGFMSNTDFLVYFWAPVATLIFRAWVFLRKTIFSVKR
jgi:hypothetical protein